MTLNDWLSAGWLQTHHASREEIEDFLARSAADLKQASQPGIALEWRFVMAYNAALGAARAALAARGFRAARDSQHVRVIESLQHSVGGDRQLIRRFMHLRKKRHEITYDSRVDISEVEAEAMTALANEVFACVAGHLNYPGL